MFEPNQQSAETVATPASAAFRRAMQSGWAELSTDQRLALTGSKLWRARSHWWRFMTGGGIPTTKGPGFSWLTKERHGELLRCLVPFGTCVPLTNIDGHANRLVLSSARGNSKLPVFRFEFGKFPDNASGLHGWRCTASIAGRSFVALDATTAGGKYALLESLDRISVPPKAGERPFARKFHGPRLLCTTSEEVVWFDARLFTSAERFAVRHQEKDFGIHQRKGRRLLAKESTAWLDQFTEVVLPYSVFACPLAQEPCEVLIDVLGGPPSVKAAALNKLFESGEKSLCSSIADYVVGATSRDSRFHRIQALIQLFRMDPTTANKSALSLLREPGTRVDLARELWRLPDLNEGVKRESALVLEQELNDPRIQSEARAWIRSHHHRPLSRRVGLVTAATSALGAGLLGGIFADRYIPATPLEKLTVPTLGPELEVLRIDDSTIRLQTSGGTHNLVVRCFRGILGGVPAELIQGKMLDMPLGSRPEIGISVGGATDSYSLVAPVGKAGSLLAPNDDWSSNAERLGSGGVIVDLYEPLWLPERRADIGMTSIERHEFTTTLKCPVDEELPSVGGVSISVLSGSEPIKKYTKTPENLHQVIHDWEDISDEKSMLSMRFKRGDPRLGVLLGKRSGEVACVDMPLLDAEIEICEKLPSGRLAPLSKTKIEGDSVRVGFTSDAQFQLPRNTAERVNQLLFEQRIVFRVLSHADVAGKRVAMVTEIPASTDTASLDRVLREVSPTHLEQQIGLTARQAANHSAIRGLQGAVSDVQAYAANDVQQELRRALHSVVERRFLLVSDSFPATTLALEGVSIHALVSMLEAKANYNTSFSQTTPTQISEDSPQGSVHFGSVTPTSTGFVDRVIIQSTPTSTGFVDRVIIQSQPEPEAVTISSFGSYSVVGYDGSREVSTPAQANLIDPSPGRADRIKFDFYPSRHGGVLRWASPPVTIPGFDLVRTRIERYLEQVEARYPQAGADAERVRAALSELSHASTEQEIIFFKPAY